MGYHLFKHNLMALEVPLQIIRKMRKMLTDVEESAREIAVPQAPSPRDRTRRDAHTRR
jgi:hypothetical protein